jgi:hypothetical protein
VRLIEKRKKERIMNIYLFIYHLVAYFAKCSSSVNVNYEIIFLGSS